MKNYPLQQTETVNKMISLYYVYCVLLSDLAGVCVFIVYNLYCVHIRPCTCVGFFAVFPVHSLWCNTCHHKSLIIVRLESVWQNQIPVHQTYNATSHWALLQGLHYFIHITVLRFWFPSALSVSQSIAEDCTGPY